ncbi:MAG: acetyl-CoA carboxylase biotin carboxyl carrier protein [Lachnospiraceae bacterium]|nr:acetyl-CoA carboxylase biotin carboxyl carrier protein [Lachnospiraceae bacterium]MDY5743011.1 acetyl-CoA carboxylase biotin carboxyl carrier protein [Lachnospiraceae bacterium]
MNITELEHLLSLMETHRLEELEWEFDHERIRLKKQVNTGSRPARLEAEAGHGPVWTAAAAAAAGEATDSEAPAEQQADAADIKIVSADMIGTFYSAPSPDAAPFVAVGDIVEKGAVLCVLEAMKLMNEVEAPFKLQVVSVEAANGSVVEYGRTLFKVREVQ